jgi:hypothetical protein
MLPSDSRMDVKICSVMRGIMPASSGDPMSAPYTMCSTIRGGLANIQKGNTIIVKVLPEPVWPYAKTVPLYPSRTSVWSRQLRRLECHSGIAYPLAFHNPMKAKGDLAQSI